MTMTYTERHDGTRTTTTHDFNATDRQGRRIGALVDTFETDFVERYEGANGGYTHPAGHVFGFTPHATRGGVTWGPVQSSRFYGTAAERDTVVAKYIRDAAKRASKKGGSRTVEMLTRPQ